MSVETGMLEPFLMRAQKETRSIALETKGRPLSHGGRSPRREGPGWCNEDGEKRTDVTRFRESSGFNGVPKTDMSISKTCKCNHVWEKDLWGVIKLMILR